MFLIFIIKNENINIIDDKVKGRFEKSWPKVQALAKMAGYGISKKMQSKGKSYMWKLRK